MIHRMCISQFVWSCQPMYSLGVQCKEEIQESIIWTRTPAATPDNTTAVLIVPCPGQFVGNDTSESISKSHTVTLPMSYSFNFIYFMP